MNAVLSPVRTVVAASLLVSMSATSLLPRFTAGETARATFCGQGGPRACCCGVQDDHCCGTACCQTPNSKENPTPTVPTRSEDRGQPLGLSAVPDARCGPTVAGVLEGFATQPAGAAGYSLIALSVRLNI
jgi:hypothetical protein